MTGLLYSGTGPFTKLICRKKALMYLVAIGWLYVALMMSVAEATNTTGSVLGAIVTFVLYGLLPTALVMYLLGAPARRRARKEREEAERLAWLAQQATQKGGQVNRSTGGLLQEILGGLLSGAGQAADNRSTGSVVTDILGQILRSQR